MKKVTYYQIGNFWIVWDGCVIAGYLYDKISVDKFEKDEFLRYLA